MVLAALSRLSCIRVTLGYAALLVGVATALFLLGPHVQQQVIQDASTNLRNLSEGRLDTLIGSAFVVDEGPIYVWLPGLVALLALAELLWRGRRVLVAFVIGHIGATLLVAAGLTIAIGLDMMSRSIVDVSDVGMSYGAVGVLGTLTAAIPLRGRPAWMGWWLTVALTSVALGGGDFTNVGHAVALILGMLLSLRFHSSARWTTTRYVLLAVAVAFGYMVMAHTPLTAATAVGVGALGAVVAELIARRRANLAHRTAIHS